MVDEIRERLQGINQGRAPNHYIGEYAVFELLGTGAFGSVYKVRRRTARQSFMAMKEVLEFGSEGSSCPCCLNTFTFRL